MAGDEEPVTLTKLVQDVASVTGKPVRMLRIPWYGAAWLAATVIEVVCKSVRVKPPVFRRRLSWFKTNRSFRIDRAKQELGYHPRVPLTEGLARTARWYRQAGYLAGLTPLTLLVA